VISTRRPMISFTFDDFPRSALLVGGAILNRYDLAGTYYASLGLAGQETATGRLFGSSDLKLIREHGHELGCHTFSHCHAWDTAPQVFERSIVANRAALGELFPGMTFETFAYPISVPRPLTKSRVADYFLCCRGGDQRFNVGTTDLNLLSAFFLEKSRNHLQPVKDVINRNRQARGWLILATHDISDDPTPFGCTPAYFEDVVQYAVRSDACILPVASALKALGAPKRGEWPIQHNRETTVTEP